MPMSMNELEKALRGLRLSGMVATLQARALQVGSHEMDFIEAFSWMVQDELDRRRSRLLDRRFTHSGLPERKTLEDIDWSYNPKLPKRALLELATLAFIDAKENVLLIGRPGTGKSHAAKAIALWPCSAATKSCIARRTRCSRKSISPASSASSKIPRAAASGRSADDRRSVPAALPPNAGEELADVLMSRYEKLSTMVTSNRPIDDWAALLGRRRRRHAAARSAHAPRSSAEVRRQELAPERIRRTSCQASRRRVIIHHPVATVGDFDPARGGGV
jgi:DNA replication protein DnaC